MMKEEYKLLEVLGEGAFGQVVRAKHRQFKQNVAIKFIETDFDDLISLRNIIREMSLLRQFTGFNDNIYVAQLIDVVVASPDRVTLDGAEGMFIVMEYVDNDLDKILKNQ